MSLDFYHATPNQTGKQAHQEARSAVDAADVRSTISGDTTHRRTSNKYPSQPNSPSKLKLEEFSGSGKHSRSRGKTPDAEVSPWTWSSLPFHPLFGERCGGTRQPTILLYLRACRIAAVRSRRRGLAISGRVSADPIDGFIDLLPAGFVERCGYAS